jgi:hypothetical protein
MVNYLDNFVKDNFFFVGSETRNNKHIILPYVRFKF